MNRMNIALMATEWFVHNPLNRAVGASNWDHHLVPLGLLLPEEPDHESSAEQLHHKKLPNKAPIFLFNNRSQLVADQNLRLWRTWQT
jgi:hypothetical protein